MSAVREDMAVALVKALGFDGDAPDEGALRQFADGLDVSKNLVRYVAIALARGIMYGYEEGGMKFFRPQGLLTRAEAAVLLYKMGGPEEKVTYSFATPVTPVPPPMPSQPTEHAAPEVTGKVDGYRIVLAWKPILDSRLQGYKVVASKSNPAPAYPDDGYLYYITDRNQTTAIIDNSVAYNGGDISGHFIPGQAYCFSVTALYKDARIKGNAVRLVFPVK
jgi:hypothetical protein